LVDQNTCMLRGRINKHMHRMAMANGKLWLFEMTFFRHFHQPGFGFELQTAFLGLDCINGRQVAKQRQRVTRCAHYSATLNEDHLRKSVICSLSPSPWAAAWGEILLERLETSNKLQYLRINIFSCRKLIRSLT